MAESCDIFEFVDDEEEGEKTEQEQHHQRSQPPSPPKLLVISSDGTKSSSAVCSPSSTSEIGSVFGLRFDPQENKMTLQLTATAGETARSPQSGSELVESSKHQPSRFPLDLSSRTRSEGGLFPSLKSQAKKSEYENATDDERKRDEVAEAVDVRREQEQVRQILASAAALQAESEWSEDDDDLSDDESNEDGQDQDCPQGPLLGSNNQHSLGNGRKLCHNRRRKFHFGLTSDVESTGYTTDDAGMENLSVFNDAGLRVLKEL